MMNRNFKQAIVRTDAGFCAHCKKSIRRGETALYKFNADTQPMFDLACDEMCAADYREAQKTANQRRFDRLSVQFN